MLSQSRIEKKDGVILDVISLCFGLFLFFCGFIKKGIGQDKESQLEIHSIQVLDYIKIFFSSLLFPWGFCMTGISHGYLSVFIATD